MGQTGQTECLQSLGSKHQHSLQRGSPEEVDSKEEECLQGLRARGAPAKGLEASTLGTQLARVPAGHLQGGTTYTRP
jgi:hypothetical protein